MLVTLAWMTRSVITFGHSAVPVGSAVALQASPSTHGSPRIVSVGSNPVPLTRCPASNLPVIVT
jgi:hypothetical protein